MRRALLTGATSGLGLSLAPALIAEGYAVRATGRDETLGKRLQAMGAEFVAADLTDPASAGPLARGVDVVFHTAALSAPWGNPESFHAMNVAATERLLSAARAAGAGAFIYTSTPSVYAAPHDRLGLTEESPLAERFANHYVITKHAAEQLVLGANAPGFRTAALRPRALIGPDDRVLLPRLLRVARTGRFPLLRRGEARIEITDVRDAAAAMIAADRAKGAAGQVFNISGGAPRSAAEILNMAFSAMGVRPRLVHLPYSAAVVICAAAEAVCARLPGRPEPFATVYSLSTLAFSQTFDLTKAREVLEWAPSSTPEQAIAYAAQRWRADAPL